MRIKFRGEHRPLEIAIAAQPLIRAERQEVIAAMFFGGNKYAADRITKNGIRRCNGPCKIRPQNEGNIGIGYYGRVPEDRCILMAAAQAAIKDER